ncbi:MAG: Tim44 domain-containing protein [Janthinobacterium lividum]
MRRTLSVVALLLALAPGLALARPGLGGSFGSRGARTYSAPPPTAVAPFAAQPMQRSLAPRSEPAPSYAPSPGYAPQPALAQPGFGGGMSRRGMFTSGLLGGLVGAGIGGMLFGHGMFGGMDGGASLLGLLLQIGIVLLIGRWLFRRFAGGQPAFAGRGMGGGLGGALGGMMRTGAAQARPGMPPSGQAGARGAALSVTPDDYRAFEQVLRDVQAAWSGGNIAALQRLATPEMVSYFGEQLAEQASQGVRNTVTAVNLDRGDLSEAWSEGAREYATVAMRFSMLDVTVDGSGRVVDGSASERVTVTELWTFLRTRGGRWLLSAIQQTR